MAAAVTQPPLQPPPRLEPDLIHLSPASAGSTFPLSIIAGGQQVPSAASFPSSATMPPQSPIQPSLTSVGPHSASATTTSGTGKTASNIPSINGLTRTATRESHHSNNSQDSARSGSHSAHGHHGGLSTVLSTAKAKLFKKSRGGSVSRNDRPSSPPAAASSASQFAPRAGGSPASSTGSFDQQPPIIDISNPPADAVKSTVSTNPPSVMRPALGLGPADRSSADSVQSRESVFSGSGTVSTSGTSPPQQSPSLTPTATATVLPSNVQPVPTTADGVQMRLKTLPRLTSYTVQRPADAGSSSSEFGQADSVDSEAEGHDTATSMSGTETEHDTEDNDMDTDDDDADEDGDDHDHDEEDVRGGVAAMRMNLQRPALPTLTSRSGGFSSGRMASFATQGAQSQNANPFSLSGWTTFATSTPTPGPLRTARPMPGDNNADGSYFDARPIPPSGSRTPAQTPRAEKGKGKQVATDTAPGSLPAPAAATLSAPPSRITLDTRQSTLYTASPAGRQQASIPTSPATSLSARSNTSNTTVGASGSAGLPSRPSFYQRQSRSMVDLSKALQESSLADAPADRGQSSPTKARSRSRSSSRPPTASSATSTNNPGIEAIPEGPSSPALPDAQQASAQQGASGRSLQRRQSMPEMRIDPPVYQIDDDFRIDYMPGQPKPSSREDEGREALPAYTCDVHIEGWVPRKMEFLKPGVQAKDRRWKRQYLILHGTSIKVYRSDPRVKAVPGEGAPPTPGIHKADHRPSFGSVSGKSIMSGGGGGGSAASRRGTVSSVISTASSSAVSVSSANSEKAPINPNMQKVTSKRRFDPDTPVHVHPQEEEGGGLASLQHAPASLLAKAGENRCVRHYTLQGAESGLAADYLKRRHVVRVRAEGEQFLIQAKDDRAVIDWIEAVSRGLTHISAVKVRQRAGRDPD